MPFTWGGITLAKPNITSEYWDFTWCALWIASSSSADRGRQGQRPGKLLVGGHLHRRQAMRQDRHVQLKYLVLVTCVFRPKSVSTKAIPVEGT